MFQPIKEKPKRKGALDAIPNTVEEWAIYDAPDEAMEAFKLPDHVTNGINSSSFSKPVKLTHASTLSLAYNLLFTV